MRSTILLAIFNLALFCADGCHAADSAVDIDMGVNSVKKHSLPVGTIVAWPQEGMPAGSEWLECNGQPVDGAAYPDLRKMMANVPDYRGMFLRGHGSQPHVQNNGASVGMTSTNHSSGALGQIQGDAIRNITGYSNYHATHSGNHNSGAISHANTRYWYGCPEWVNVWAYAQDRFDASGVVPTANENRPVNKAVKYMIKAK